MEIKPYLRRPQFYETDGMSIIWHGNYVRWMEEARTDFMEDVYKRQRIRLRNPCSLERWRFLG